MKLLSYKSDDQEVWISFNEGGRWFSTALSFGDYGAGWVLKYFGVFVSFPVKRTWAFNIECRFERGPDGKPMPVYDCPTIRCFQWFIATFGYNHGDWFLGYQCPTPYYFKFKGEGR